MSDYLSMVPLTLGGESPSVLFYSFEFCLISAMCVFGFPSAIDGGFSLFYRCGYFGVLKTDRQCLLLREFDLQPV